jgi:hypothetical protein
VNINGQLGGALPCPRLPVLEEQRHCAASSGSTAGSPEAESGHRIPESCPFQRNVRRKHEPQTEVTIGQQLDTVAPAMVKARRLAEKSTMHYLESNCDSDAKALLDGYVLRHSARDFYMFFFQRHALAALVFGIPGPVLNWNCRNASDCCVNLIQELTASGSTAGPPEAESRHRIPESWPFQRNVNVNVRSQHEPEVTIDTVAHAMVKAQWFAEKSTMHYLESNCDSDAKALLDGYVLRHSATASDFYMAFFQRHALVFGIRSPVLNWNCWNTSDCCVNLIQELTASGSTASPPEAESANQITKFECLQVCGNS